MNDARRLWLMVLFALWALAWGGSFGALLPPVESAGDADGIAAFLGWQGLAAAIAVAVWGMGRAWPWGAPARALSRVPLWLAGLMAAAWIIRTMVFD